MTSLTLFYKMVKLTILTLLKNQYAIKGADVAKEVSMLTKQSTQMLQEKENLLLTWLKEKQPSDDSISKAMMLEKVKKLHNYLLQENPSTYAKILNLRQIEGGLIKSAIEWHPKCDKKW